MLVLRWWEEVEGSGTGAGEGVGGVGMGMGLLGYMAGAGGGELVGVDEESPVGVAGVEGDHPVVDVLLRALAVVAGGEEAAGRVRGEAGLQPGGLGVVVVAVAVLLGDVLEDDAPVSLHVDSATDLGVVHLGRAEVSLGARPVGEVEGGGALGGARVVGVVEGLLLVAGDVLHQVVGALLGHVRVLLEEDGVLGDLVGDLVLWVLGVVDAEGEVGVEGALGGRLGVTVAVGAAVGSGVRGAVGHGVRRSVGDWVRGAVGHGGVRGGGGVVDGAGGGRHGDRGQGHHHCGYLRRKGNNGWR